MGTKNCRSLGRELPFVLGIRSLRLMYRQNRVTQHSAIVDWKTGERRHLARITPQAERPYETPYVPEPQPESKAEFK